MRIDALPPGAHPSIVHAAPAGRVADDDALTPRELDVLRLLSTGCRNRAIGEKLFVSEFTVKAHLHRINSKLGAHSRTEAVAIGRARGLIE